MNTGQIYIGGGGVLLAIVGVIILCIKYDNRSVTSSLTPFAPLLACCFMLLFVSGVYGAFGAFAGKIERHQTDIVRTVTVNEDGNRTLGLRYGSINCPATNALCATIRPNDVIVYDQFNGRHGFSTTYVITAVVPVAVPTAS